MTTLSSKIINVHKKKMAKIAVDAVMAVANLDRNDVNFDMIKVGCGVGTRKARLTSGMLIGGMMGWDAKEEHRLATMTRAFALGQVRMPRSFEKLSRC